MKKKNSDQNCWKLARLELRSEVLTCSDLRGSWLVLTWSPTLTGIPLAGANSKLHNYQQKVQEKEDLLKTWLSPKNRLKISDDKKYKNFSILARRTKQGNHNTRKATTEHGRRKRKKNWTKIEKQHSEWNCRNFATLDLRSQVLTHSTFI